MTNQPPDDTSFTIDDWRAVLPPATTPEVQELQDELLSMVFPEQGDEQQ